jgi:uncharacterized membrane protein
MPERPLLLLCRGEIPMEKMIVVVFDDESKAVEGLKALWKLDREGDVSIYAEQIVAKEPSGAVRLIDNPDMSSLPMIGGGAAVGALVGALAGPAGALVGATAGAVIGTITDVEESGVTDEFVNDVTTTLAPGKAALVADISEERVTPVDARMEEIGGVVFRRARTLVKDTQEDRDAAAHRAEMEQLKAERAQARSDRLAKIDARIDHLRAKLEAAIERKRVKMQLRQQEREAKIQALQKRADQSEGAVRESQEARIADLRRDYAEMKARG